MRGRLSRNIQITKPDTSCKITRRFKAPPATQTRLMVGFSLQRETVDKLTDAANRTNRSRSYLVDLAVGKFLGLIEKNLKILEGES